MEVTRPAASGYAGCASGLSEGATWVRRPPSSRSRGRRAVYLRPAFILLLVQARSTCITSFFRRRSPGREPHILHDASVQLPKSDSEPLPVSQVRLPRGGIER